MIKMDELRLFVEQIKIVFDYEERKLIEEIDILKRIYK